MIATAVYRVALVLGEYISALAIVEQDGREDRWLVRDLRKWPQCAWPVLVAHVSQVLAGAVQFAEVPRLVVEASQVGRPVLELFHAAHREGFLPTISPARVSGIRRGRDLLARLEVLLDCGALEFPREIGKVDVGDEAVRTALALAVGRGQGQAFVEAWRRTAVAWRPADLPTRENYSEWAARQR